MLHKLFVHYLKFIFQCGESFMVNCTIYSPGADLIRQGWNRRGPNVLQEGYGSAAVLPEQGIYLAASVYRPVLQVFNSFVIIIHKLMQGFFFFFPYFESILWHFSVNFEWAIF